ncbi:MAG: AAA-like domain-containing protein, partial [Oscillospiraceae bacterium]|nr:AAA-like domain-containing protein [Oscillospiraceae bacterium]
MKEFKAAGICVPEKNYMVDISGKIAQIKKLIDKGCYFTINRARQYGKTTTLYELRKHLANEYLVIKISFEGLGDESFSSPEQFCPAFTEQIAEALQSPSVAVEQKYIDQWENCNVRDFKSLNRHITKMCKGKKIVLLIDEVDRTSNNRVFLQFLSVLRSKFLAREGGDGYTFHSVVLAGVYNSPWNIAVDFEVDMSFNPEEISTMLQDYEADHKTGMDIAAISEELYECTGGYPFLVSRICQHIDEELDRLWTSESVKKAVEVLLTEKNTFF